MTQEEKTRLIAEFDGWEFVGHIVARKDGVRRLFDETSDNYKSYDELMPVWHKFRNAEIVFPDDETMAYVEMMGDYYRMTEKIKYAILFKEIEDVFNALAEAIEWFNTTKK